MPSRQTFVQAGVIVLVAIAAGLVRNTLLPEGVAITCNRPRPPAETPEFEEGAAILSDIAIAPGGAQGGPCSGSRTRLCYVTLAQFDSLRVLEGVVLVDARSRQSFAKGHIPGAVNLPVDEVWEQQTKLAELIRARAVLVYCEDPRCDAAKRLADELLAHGCTAIAIYHAGIRRWLDAGRPVVRGEEGRP